MRGVLVADDLGEHFAHCAVDVVHEQVDEKQRDRPEERDRPVVEVRGDIGGEDFDGLQTEIERGERAVDEHYLDGIGNVPLDLFLPHDGGDERHGTEIERVADHGGDVADEKAQPCRHDVGECGGGVVAFGDGSHDCDSRRREHGDGDVAHHHSQPDKQKRQRRGDARERKRICSLFCGYTPPFHQQQRMRSPPRHSQQQSAQMAHWHAVQQPSAAAAV